MSSSIAGCWSDRPIASSFGRGIPYGTDNQPVGRHRSSVPRFQGRAADRAVESGDLPTGDYFLGATIDGAAPAGSVMRFEHADLCARKAKQATSKFDLAIGLR
jgi:hypothetical protein